MRVTLKNNTDYRSGVTFTTIKQLKKFVKSYYQGEEGSAYWETWRVDGDYPESIYNILSQKETGGWGRA